MMHSWTFDFDRAFEKNKNIVRYQQRRIASKAGVIVFKLRQTGELFVNLISHCIITINKHLVVLIIFCLIRLYYNMLKTNKKRVCKNERHINWHSRMQQQDTGDIGWCQHLRQTD
jgi:hypothetical protein